MVVDDVVCWLSAMNMFVQRLVSGNRARFEDKELNLELDLTYINDQLIVMAYPGDGFQAYIRNSRSDALKFLNTRHGDNFWVFNFCPVAENSYDKSVFEGRVSRYPFPDHHAPPLSLLPLAANEIRRWTQGNPKHVAVLHCKAGKGRSGTLACAYLLSLENIPGRPQPSRARLDERADELIHSMPSDEEEGATELVNEETRPNTDKTATDHSDEVKDDSMQTGKVEEKNTESNNEVAPGMAAVKDILDLHTSKRLKPSAKGQGVSIPSQRRWLHYYGRVLSGDAPYGFWSLDDATLPPPSERRTALLMRIRITLGASTLTRAVNTLLRTRAPKVWAVAGRYEDDLVDKLEIAYRNLVRAQNQTQDEGLIEAERVFTEEAKWDKGKMVWRFARFRGKRGTEKTLNSNEKGDGEEKEFATEYELIPDGPLKTETETNQPELGRLKNSVDIHSETEPEFTDTDNEAPVPGGFKLSKPRTSTKNVDASAGIPVDPNREVRIKLFMGRVPLGWFWIIPAFHRTVKEEREITIKLGGDAVDFAFGVGGDILSVEIDLKFGS